AASKKLRGDAKKSLQPLAIAIMSRLAQIRTCLWPCVGRWASGQEAGQPPEGSICFLTTVTGSRRRNRRTPPSPAAPASSNDGAGFFGLVGPPKVNTEEACPSLPACGSGSPAPIKPALRVRSCTPLPRLHRAAKAEAPHRRTPGDNARLAE